MNKAIEFGKKFLFHPADAADACASKTAVDEGLKVYAAWVVVSLAYLWLKPHDFPDAAAPVAAQPEGPAFWLRVACWEPLLAALNIALTAMVLEWMREGWLPLKTAVATLWSAVPLILTYAYTRTGMSRLVFGTLIILWSLPGLYVARRVPGGEWRKVTAFLLGLNAIGLVLLVPEIAAAVLRSDHLYKATLFASVGWLLACGGIGLSRLCRTSTARAVLAFLFANLVLNLVIAAAFLLHWVPMEVLKVLVYV
ncbi:MAG: hypothetical protein KGL74_01735 [Elusimicrobia bacterium]|nr:hypothetical protein [Elusimicrobiota bacterium]